MKAIIYAAKSTLDVHDSLPGQVADCEALAEREGLEVVATFTDENESAYHGNRGPELEGAMDLCEQAAPCALIVQHTSRLARGNVRQSRHLVEVAVWAIRHDVEIRSVENPLPQDQLLLLAAVAGDQDHAYSKRLGTSVSGGLLRSFQRGNWPAKPSDGYLIEIERDSGGRTVQRGLVKDPEMSEAMERMFNLALEQMLPPAEIARQLNGGQLTNKRGQMWRSRDVKRALTNPMYAGILQFKGEERRGGCEPYVTEEQHATLIQRYGDTAPRSGGPRRKGRRSAGHVLQGLAVCGRCGEPMDCFTRNDYADGVPRRSYRCRSFVHHTGECDARVDASEVDAEVVRWLDYLISDFDTWRTQVLEAASSEHEQAQGRLDEALARIDTFDRRAGKLEQQHLKAIDAGLDAAAEVMLGQIQRNAENRRQATEEVEARRAVLDSLEAEVVADQMAKTVERLSSQDVHAMNEALHVEFERFVIDPASRNITPEWKPPEKEFSLREALEKYQAALKNTEASVTGTR